MLPTRLEAKAAVIRDERDAFFDVEKKEECDMMILAAMEEGFKRESL